ncbi:AAA family ATPase [Singulisphaera rosea]
MGKAPHKPKASKPPRRTTQAEKPSALASYFLSLTLSNVRCFGEPQTLDLSDGQGGPARWSILLGENGTGKTTLLQVLAYIARLAETIPPAGDAQATHALNSQFTLFYQKSTFHLPTAFPGAKIHKSPCV